MLGDHPHEERETWVSRWSEWGTPAKSHFAPAHFQFPVASHRPRTKAKLLACPAGCTLMWSLLSNAISCHCLLSHYLQPQSPPFCFSNTQAYFRLLDITLVDCCAECPARIVTWLTPCHNLGLLSCHFL